MIRLYPYICSSFNFFKKLPHFDNFKMKLKKKTVSLINYNVKHIYNPVFLT